MKSEEIEIESFGTITIGKGAVMVNGFKFSNASCREGAILACAWAIGELQREMMKTIERPGGGFIIIGNPLPRAED